MAEYDEEYYEGRLRSILEMHKSGDLSNLRSIMRNKETILRLLEEYKQFRSYDRELTGVIEGIVLSDKVNRGLMLVHS